MHRRLHLDIVCVLIPLSPSLLSQNPTNLEIMPKPLSRFILLVSLIIEAPYCQFYFKDFRFDRQLSFKLLIFDTLKHLENSKGRGIKTFI